VAVISLGEAASLAGLLGGLVSACGECAAELVVVRPGPAVAVPELDQCGVRLVHGRPDEDLAGLRARGFAELGTDVTVLATEEQLTTCDWNTMLTQLGQMVQMGGAPLGSAQWASRLRAAAAADPAT